MFNITVTDNETAKRVAHEYDVVISLRSNPDSVGFEHPVHHIECFADVLTTEAGGASYDNIESIGRFVDMITTVDRVIANWQEEIVDLGAPPKLEILVHCYAGKSRSTAVAIGLLVAFKKLKVAEAFRIVYAQRNDVMWPNELVLRHFQKYILWEYGHERDLVGYLASWKGQRLMEGTGYDE